MVNDFSSTVDFLKALNGQWIHPTTQTRFQFVCVPAHTGSGKIYIRAHRSKGTVHIPFTSARSRQDMVLCVGDTQYKVAIIGHQVKSLAIYLNREDILQLIKNI